MDINKIISDGFYLNEKKNDSDFAFLSLNIALKAYATTYKSFLDDDKGVFHFLKTKLDVEETEYPYEYVINASETIIHLHHFFELLIKAVLRNEHTLLDKNAFENELVLAKLLKNVEFLEDDLDNIPTIEFSKALRRLFVLIDNNFIDIKFHFLKDYKLFFEALNKLRNRLLHRGVFILNYHALDRLMIDFAVPLIHLISRKSYFLI